MGRGPELSPQLRSRICELRSIGWTTGQIHKKHPDVPISTIKSTIRREALRENNVSRPRTGARRKLTEEDRDYLYDLVVHQNPNITHADLLEAVDHKIKARSLQYLLREMGIRTSHGG
ncbi:hypothetical protein JX265_003093 [Neoarthrinium moseri]|uniref:Uncharacterized protein n=1 Tax=Neoarthrinium moseri TaxID=1658444 RepID=A0A9P9WT81_9PEZI|nr:uncharacterized protein JN550_011289 [Neoarthrinium moseri]KAI1852611.1 hypothetical protein JX266_002152 [Neoarthrinium moseri]KAI1860827.1 hypothetical protein JN550_011289 [Neoarthrinium moseri]KAI1878916.1 hypothetical protein JX265_003093 [Neoarthrinium moseri]